MYSLFHILMTKTNYDQLKNFKRIEKKIEKSSVNPITSFGHKYMKETIIQFKSKIILKSISWGLKNFFNWIERKIWSELSKWTSK